MDVTVENLQESAAALVEQGVLSELDLEGMDLEDATTAFCEAVEGIDVDDDVGDDADKQEAYNAAVDIYNVLTEDSEGEGEGEDGEGEGEDGEGEGEGEDGEGEGEDGEGEDGEGEGEEEEPAEKPAKNKPSKAATKPGKKPAKDGGKKGGGVAKGPGVIAKIKEVLEGASKNKPVSKNDILKVLVKAFPDRSSESMAKTINVQVPNRMNKEKNLGIKTVEGKDGKPTRYYTGK